MGLLGNVFGGGRMKDPVRGTAQVVACTGYQGDGVLQSCRIQLVVQAEGVPAAAIEHSGLVHRKRWPAPGMTLPVTVDRASPDRVKIEWDEVESSRDRAQANAEGLAAAMRAEGGSPDGVGTAGTTPQRSDEEVDGDLDRLERLAKLHEQGVLTDAEFDQQKKQVLEG